MKVLGIDTSTSCGSVGLIDEEWVISDYLLNYPVTHSERLLVAIELVLRESRRLRWRSGRMGHLPRSGLLYGIENRGEHGERAGSFATGKARGRCSDPRCPGLQIALYPLPDLPDPRCQKGRSLYRFLPLRRRGILRRQSPFQAIRPEDLIEEDRRKDDLCWRWG